eukprot:72426-Pelagomonas_calceolata.AAC.1
MGSLDCWGKYFLYNEIKCCKKKERKKKKKNYVGKGNSPYTNYRKGEEAASLHRFFLSYSSQASCCLRGVQLCSPRRQARFASAKLPLQA